jgi:hypothetical protein
VIIFQCLHCILHFLKLFVQCLYFVVQHQTNLLTVCTSPRDTISTVGLIQQVFQQVLAYTRTIRMCIFLTHLTHDTCVLSFKSFLTAKAKILLFFCHLPTQLVLSDSLQQQKISQHKLKVYSTLSPTLPRLDRYGAPSRVCEREYTNKSQ